MTTQPPYRLGLDVGTNSLGWCVLPVDGDGAPSSLAAAGVRIFPDGRGDTSKATLAATRRAARSARRRHDRYKQRRQYLLDVLTKAGLFLKDAEARQRLQKLDPLQLRARALTEKLQPHEIGRALFHLNQRRGFQSNRKDRSDEVTSGRVSDSVRRLLEEMQLIGVRFVGTDEYKALAKSDKAAAKEARVEEETNRKAALEALAARADLTYGSFLWERRLRGQPTRARPGAGDDGKLYDVYPTRALYDDEFNKIWSAQARHHPQLMDEATRDLVHRVIFTQRPLKPQKRGQCAYMEGEECTYRAMPSFQRYRIHQDVNNLDWMTRGGKVWLRDYPEARNLIVELLEAPTTKNGLVVWGKMKSLLKKMELAEGDFQLNFETPKRDGFDGNLTSHAMRHEDCVGPAWHDWPLEKQDAFVGAMFEQVDDEKRPGELREQSDDEVRERLMHDFGLSEHAADNCMRAPLPDGTANISLKAAQLMLDKMRDGITDPSTGEFTLPLQNEAATAVACEVDGFVDPMRKPKTDEAEFVPDDRLPYYGEAFQDGAHIIPGTRAAEDKHDDLKYFGGVTNPSVHIALNQIRAVVNELIARFGHPHSIGIELGRELPAGEKGRAEIVKVQNENEKRKERLNARLGELGEAHNHPNRLRLRLWEDLADDPNGRCCPFSGVKIGIADLFDAGVEVEHLLPYSRTLDDGYANKVICTQRANRHKGNRTPWEAFHDSPGNYDWDAIFERVKALPKAKQWRFQQDAMEVWLREHKDFSERHLNDTRYIGRLAREYLQRICHIDKIDVVTGRLTAELRWQWGLNKVLQPARADADGAPKNREDHRHHAVDAIVVGMTTKSMLQRVATQANRAEEQRLKVLFPKDEHGRSVIDPRWFDADGGEEKFRDAVRRTVRDIVVSHKRKSKTPRYAKDAGGGRKLSKKGLPIKLGTDGQLHNATAYGVTVRGKVDWTQPVQVVTRWPVDKFAKREQLEKLRRDGSFERGIRDPHLRAEFVRAFDADGVEGVKRLAAKRGIRTLRYVETLNVIPVRDRKTGRVYKAHKGNSNWGMEIYQLPDGLNTDKRPSKPGDMRPGEWKGVVVTRHQANQPDFKSGDTYRPDGAAKLVMRLQIDDCVEVERDGRQQIWVVHGTTDGSITFAELHEANVDARVRKKAFKAARIAPNKLRKLNARKVRISPTGLVNYELRRKPRRRAF